MIHLPGFKSQYIRTLALGLLNKKPMMIHNRSRCDDAYIMESFCRAMGAKITYDGDSLKFEPPSLLSPDLFFYAEDSGFASRLAIAICSMVPGSATVSGSKNLRKRPLKPLTDALLELGALWEGDELPITKKSTALNERCSVDGSISSQYLSALVLAAAFREMPTIITRKNALVSQPYLDLTVHTLNEFGGKVEISRNEITVYPGITGISHAVMEPDFSSLSYFLLYATLHQRELEAAIPKESLQADANFLKILETMGGKFTWERGVCKFIPPSTITPGEFDLTHCPDLFPTLAVLCAQASGKSRIFGAPHLRFKESDRIKSVVESLQLLGVPAEETDDGAIIEGSQLLLQAQVVTHGDHRLAMAFKVLQTRYGGITIDDENCVRKSFDGFHLKLEEVMHS